MNYLIIKDCRKSVLDDEVWKDSIDYGLFHITPERRILDKNVFADCYFFNLIINHKVEWGAPIPSTFQSIFSGPNEVAGSGRGNIISQYCRPL